ncbi:MAG: class I SAM-dependent methyltransferase [Planctomycetota bacterium]|jgi:SAM-dependent methyltransferase
MSLKDASAYNIQFEGARPVLLDTLSFEKYKEGEPWVAYRQFCQHFLAPLALMSRRDVRLGQLLRVYIDGVPLDLASRLLPRRTRLSPSLYAHIHLHARFQSRFAGGGAEVAQARQRKISRLAFAGLADNLESTVSKLSWKAAGTEWADYYDETNYTAGAFAEKERLVAEFLEQAKPSTVWDLGANTGRFSRIAADKGALVVSFDIDPVAVERNYLDRRKEGSPKITPLTLDLTNPSPSLGWHLTERDSLVARGPADAVLALALVHHLAISNNVPLAMIADFLADIGKWLVIEWVPKSDSQVKRLLATREDIFTDYTREAFERALERRFEILRGERLKESERTLYLTRARA